jgi:predicted enzyme related to lactoylglutathione lyase
MLKRQDSVKVPVITISVRNTDVALVQVEKNGGKIVSTKMPVGDMGFAAYFKDSEGNVIGLWQNA